MMDAGFYASLTEGDSGSGHKLCMGLGEGDFWVRANGCQNLYRGNERGLFDFEAVLNVSGISDGLIAVPVWCAHLAGEAYVYLVRRVNRCGEEEKSFGAALMVSFGDGGNIVERSCNEATELTAVQFGADKVLLLWNYSPLSQAKLPAMFMVYCGEEVIGEVEYYSKGLHSFVADGLGSGRFGFAVRGVDRDGNILDDTKSISIDMKSLCQATDVDIEMRKL